MSFGGRLAQIREIKAWNSARRAWNFGRLDLE